MRIWKRFQHFRLSFLDPTGLFTTFLIQGSSLVFDFLDLQGMGAFARRRGRKKPAVREMIPHIQIILKEYDHLLDKKDTMEELKDRELTICTFDAFSELFTIEFLQTFMQSYPHTAKILHTGHRAHLKSGIQPGFYH